jgi:hypothetical protein
VFLKGKKKGWIKGAIGLMVTSLKFGTHKFEYKKNK